MVGPPSANEADGGPLFSGGVFGRGFVGVAGCLVAVGLC